MNYKHNDKQIELRGIVIAG